MYLKLYVTLRHTSVDFTTLAFIEAYKQNVHLHTLQEGLGNKFFIAGFLVKAYLFVSSKNSVLPLF